MSSLQHLCNQQVELVLTAHPTQALRASLLKKYAHIRKELDNLHNKRMSPYEKVHHLSWLQSNKTTISWSFSHLAAQTTVHQPFLYGEPL
jgi:phosphoenolpyruvate carboxylase